MRILSKISLEKKFIHWPKIMNRNLLKKNEQVINSEKIAPKKYAGSTWVSTVFKKMCHTKKPLPVSDLQHIVISEKNVSGTMVSYDDSQDTGYKPEQVSVMDGSTLNLAAEKSARPFFRYSMNNTDRRNFQYRRITQPFKPVYEVEWQKDQWLQLDKSTNKQIEGLRKHGFSKVPIRKDTILMKHIMYDDPSELDILLELDLCNNNDLKKNIIDGQTFLPFSVRRTHWWHTSYQIGQANLPDWVDTDICCTPSVPSVFTVVSNHPSRSIIQPLQYNEPPFMLAQSV